MSTLENLEETHLCSKALEGTADLPTRTADGARTITLFDIAWYDVLIPKVVSLLTLKDLFNLRCCCSTAKDFVDAVLEQRKEINLAGNTSANISEAFKVLANCCCHLERLHLAGCIWLTDELLVPLLEKNKRLREVNLNGCTNLTPLALQPIIIECKELRVLKLSRCHWLTTGAVDALTLHHSKLEEFDISHCTAIGERCLIIFFRKLNRLNVLSLAYTPSVTDNVLIQLGNYCKALEHINLAGCTSISDYGIKALTSSNKNLKSLMINRCPSVTEFCLAPLRQRLHIDRQPRLREILDLMHPFITLQV